MLSASNASVRCEACKSYRKSLRSMHSRSIKSNDKENSDLSIHANHRFMKSSVKIKLLSQLHRKVRISNKRKCLQEKLEAATRIHGVELDEELHRDMQDIMRSHAHSVSQLKADSFPKIFWQQQMKAASLKDQRGMRWHPLMIKWCLYLRHCSSGCYETHRQSHVLTLPSQRTLRDYTYAVQACIGYSSEGVKQLFKAACAETCEDFKKNVLLTMDEMYT